MNVYYANLSAIKRYYAIQEREAKTLYVGKTPRDRQKVDEEVWLRACEGPEESEDSPFLSG